MPGIESISGRVGKVVFKTRKNGQTYMYPSEPSERKTKISANEIRNREAFATAAREWHNMAEIIRNHWRSEYQFNEQTYNGKKYATLRGYFLAKKMAELKNEKKKKPFSEQHKTCGKAARTQQKHSGTGSKDTQSAD